MQIYLEQPKDVHYHGVEGHPKTGGKQIAEHRPQRRSPDEAGRRGGTESSSTSRAQLSSALLIDPS